MVDWLTMYPVETSGARCEGPKRMHKRKLTSLRHDQLKCYGKPVILSLSELNLLFPGRESTADCIDETDPVLHFFCS